MHNDRHGIGCFCAMLEKYSIDPANFVSLTAEAIAAPSDLAASYTVGLWNAADIDSAVAPTLAPDDPLVGWQFDVLNLSGALNRVSGAGVRVGIVDDGVHHWHPDLAVNYDHTIDYDARAGDADAAAGFGDYHGTMVAGVIAAAADGAGTVGVAPDATIAGFRIGQGC